MLSARFLLLRPWPLLGSLRHFLLKLLPHFLLRRIQKVNFCHVGPGNVDPMIKHQRKLLISRTTQLRCVDWSVGARKRAQICMYAKGITVDPQEDNLFEWKCTIKGAV